MEAALDIGFGNIENDGGFDSVAGSSGDGHNLSFFALPATNRGEDEGGMVEVWAFEVRQNPFVKEVGRNELASAGVVFFGLLFHAADDNTGRKKLGV